LDGCVTEGIFNVAAAATRGS